MLARQGAKMKVKKSIINTVRAEKASWSPEEIDKWIEARLRDLRKSSPSLWQFVADAQKELFQHVCEVSTREKHTEGFCPAEEARRHLLMRLLELTQMYEAQSEVEQLEKLWKTRRTQDRTNDI